MKFKGIGKMAGKHTFRGIMSKWLLGLSVVGMLGILWFFIAVFSCLLSQQINDGSIYVYVEFWLGIEEIFTTHRIVLNVGI